MDDKVYLDSNGVTRDSFALARKIYDSGFRPDVVIALWRGGTPVGIVVHEFFEYMGVHMEHAAVKAVSYTGIGQRGAPRVEQLEPVLAAMRPGARVLLVDDIFDSGCTVREVIRRLAVRTSAVKVATLYVKAGANQTDIAPDFCGRVTTNWIVFPHELVGLTEEEIHAKDPAVHGLVGGVRPPA